MGLHPLYIADEPKVEERCDNLDSELNDSFAPSDPDARTFASLRTIADIFDTHGGHALTSPPLPHLLKLSYACPTSQEWVDSKLSVTRLESVLLRINKQLDFFTNITQRFESASHEVRQSIQQHKSIYAPIHSLPNEILVKIFSVHPSPISFSRSASSSRTRRAMRKVALALVCRRWYDMVYGTPSLWTTIVYSAHQYHSNPSTTHQASMLTDLMDHIHYSSNLPLSVTITCWVERPPNPFPTPEGLGPTDPTVPNEHAQFRNTCIRWESLKISYNHIWALFCEELLPTSYPNLKHLTITDSREPPSGEISVMSDATSMPQLARLELRGTATMEKTILQSVQMANVSHLSITAPAELPCIIDLLRQMPLLVSLKISENRFLVRDGLHQSHIDFFDDMGRGIDTMSLVADLPGLTTIKVCAAPSTIGHLLRLLKCPSLSEMTLQLPSSIRLNPPQHPEPTSTTSPIPDYDQATLDFFQRNLLSFLHLSSCPLTLRKLALSNLPINTLLSMFASLPRIEDLTLLLPGGADSKDIRDCITLLQRLIIIPGSVASEADAYVPPMKTSDNLLPNLTHFRLGFVNPSALFGGPRVNRKAFDAILPTLVLVLVSRLNITSPAMEEPQAESEAIKTLKTIRVEVSHRQTSVFVDAFQRLEIIAKEIWRLRDLNVTLARSKEPFSECFF